MSTPDHSFSAPVKKWLAMPMETSAYAAIERVRRAEDVVHVAVLPDVHIAGDVCVGTAMATKRLLYPSAVGGDIGCDHNHVRREEHFGESLYVHRKGAMCADAGLAGVVPGSMGTQSLHVEGRGCADSLRSGAHGAGRLLSRHAAREQFGRTNFRRQMQGVWFDPRLGDALREESPKAYKDVQSVMRAQRDLVKVTRTLRPLVVYKGR